MYTPMSAQVKAMFASIADRYDITNTVLSLGIHHLWKRDFIAAIPAHDVTSVMDLACGTGDLVPLLKKRFDTRIVGVDFCEPMLAVARKNYPQYEFLQGDALKLSLPDHSFDVVTVSFGVRNFENLEGGLKEILRVLKPGGTIAILEFGQPSGFLFGQMYRWYSRHIMPIIGGLLTGNKDAYQYLPETAQAFPCGDRFLQILQSVGYKGTSMRRYTCGIAYGYYGKKT